MDQAWIDWLNRQHALFPGPTQYVISLSYYVDDKKVREYIKSYHHVSSGLARDLSRDQLDDLRGKLERYIYDHKLWERNPTQMTLV